MDDFLEGIPRVFHRNGTVEALKELTLQFDELNSAADAFTGHFSVTCPSACGTCCEHFIPDITSREALLASLYLLYVRKDQRLFDALYREDHREGCPLYRSDDPHHCQVYPVRPTVCRSFNSLPSKDKEGRLRFRSCRFTDEQVEKVTLSDEEIRERFPEMLSMSDFGSLVLALSSYEDTAPLPDLIRQTIDKILLLERYGEDQEDCSTDTPDDDSPPPLIAV